MRLGRFNEMTYNLHCGRVNDLLLDYLIGADLNNPGLQLQTAMYRMVVRG